MATSTTSKKPNSSRAAFNFSGVTLGPNWPAKAGAISAITLEPDLISFINWKI